jgi:phosphatidylinositol dimannoside acyltransferase
VVSLPADVAGALPAEPSVTDSRPRPGRGGGLTLLTMRVGVAIAPLLPGAPARALAEIGGAAAYALGAAARRGVAANLAVVLGRHDPDLVALRAREAFRTQAANYLDLVGLSRLSLDEIEQRVVLEGWQHLESALSGGRGAILAAVHLGNVDLVAQLACARGLSVTFPIEPIEPRELLALVTGLRSAHGLELVPTDRGALRAIVRALRAGGLVGLAIDRDVQGSGQPTPLFGRSARLSHAPAVLALRTGAPIVPAGTHRLGAGRYAARLGPPIAPTGTAADLMARVVPWLERAIRETPGQWVMFQPLFDDERASRSG